ncbi:MAG: hypothetical protein LRY54_01360 [Alphaproteobacteria bacterium]|nr:hypothetical protein [Alphaproteobacteria bacterium]
MELGISFRSASEVVSRDIMGMGMPLASSLGFGPAAPQSAVGNDFYASLTEGKPQVSIPIVHKQSVAVSQKADLKQNALSNTGALRGQINQAKNNFLDTMKDAKMEAAQAITDAAKANGMNPGHVIGALMPQKPCEAVNLLLACDPTCISTIWSTVSNVSAQCSNADIDRVLTQALKTLHDAGKARQQGQQATAAKTDTKSAATPGFSWEKFNTDDLKRFAAADPLKDDNTGKQIVAVEQTIIEMERNQKDLKANYTTTGDVYDKVKHELDRAIVDKGLVAEMIGLAPKSAAECVMLAECLPEIKGLKLEKEENDIPPLDSVEEVQKKLAEAAPKPEPDMLKRLMAPLGGLNPFRHAA